MLASLPDDLLLLVVTAVRRLVARRALAATSTRLSSLVRRVETLTLQLRFQTNCRHTEFRVEAETFVCIFSFPTGADLDTLREVVAHLLCKHQRFVGVAELGSVCFEQSPAACHARAMISHVGVILPQAIYGSRMKDVMLRDCVLPPDLCKLLPCLAHLRLWECSVAENDCSSFAADLAGLAGLQTMECMCPSDPGLLAACLACVPLGLTTLAIEMPLGDDEDADPQLVSALDGAWPRLGAGLRTLTVLNSEGHTYVDFNPFFRAVQTRALSNLVQLAMDYELSVTVQQLFDGQVMRLLEVLPSLASLGKITLHNAGTHIHSVPNIAEADWFFPSLPVATVTSPLHRLKALHFSVIDSIDLNWLSYEWGVGGTLAAIVRGINKHAPWVDSVFLEWYHETMAPVTELAATLAPLQRSQLEQRRTVHLIPTYVGFVERSPADPWAVRPARLSKEAATALFARALPGLTVRVREPLPTACNTGMSNALGELEGMADFGGRIAARGLLASEPFHFEQ